MIQATTSARFGTMIAIIAGVLASSSWSQTAELPASQGKAAGKYPDTVVTSVLDYAIPEGKNLIWCASFQLAWNELRDGIIKSDVILLDGPEWVSILNSKSVTKDDLSADAFVALVGRQADNIVGRINEELQRKFAPPVPVVREDPDPNTIIAYAYLRKALRFAEVFDTRKEPLEFRSGADK